MKDYKSRLVLFPRRLSKQKKGDSSPEDITSVRQLKGVIVKAPAPESAISFTKISEVFVYCFLKVIIIIVVSVQELTSFKAHSTLRNAMNDAKLVGIRLKKSKEQKDEVKPKDE